MQILVTHASAGAGHRKAAEALAAVLRERSDVEVVLVDALDHTPPFYKKVYVRFYAFLVSRCPAVWGGVFRLLEMRGMRPLLRALRACERRLFAGQLVRFLEEGRFDAVVATHFLPAAAAARLKRRGRIPSRLITVVTDYDVHPIWTAAGVDHYAVACDRTRDRLSRQGVAFDRIAVTGIPTSPAFGGPHDVSRIEERLGLRPGRFTALVATGSFGLGAIEAIVRALPGCRILVVCGWNQALYERLRRDAPPNVAPFAMVDNMDELMAVSDVMITKPGGLSISEALVSRLPMIFFHAIPGQEEHNIRVLARYGVGSVARSPEQVAAIVRNFREDPRLLDEERDRMAALARPGAAHRIAALACGCEEG